MIGEVVGELARDDRLRRGFDFVLDSYHIDRHFLPGHVEHHVARAPVTILGASDGTRVHVVNTLYDAMPRHVRMPEADHIASARTERRTHLLEERIRAVTM